MTDITDMIKNTKRDNSNNINKENISNKNHILPYLKKIKKRKTIVKEEGVTNPDIGKNPEKRTIEELLNYGIINVNKPKGPTSHQVSEFVKKILKVKKAGQSGTLDPGVTGVLPVGINKSTRVLQSLLNAGKEYVCLMYIHKPHTKEEIYNSCEKFIGDIQQLPPIKSAVKREVRTRTIYYLDIIEIDKKNQHVLFKVGCQAGTYIRRLCDDIGKDLKCGAHMVQLIRTQVGVFNDNNMYTLQNLEDQYNLYKKGNKKAEIELKKIILPMETAVEHIPKVWIFDSAIPYICNGMDLAIPGISKFDSDIKIDELVAIMSLKDELVALGFAKMKSKEIDRKEKGMAIRTNKVIIQQDLYKKISKI